MSSTSGSVAGVETVMEVPSGSVLILSSVSGKIINLPTMWINMLEIYAEAGPDVDRYGCTRLVYARK